MPLFRLDDDDDLDEDEDFDQDDEESDEDEDESEDDPEDDVETWQVARNASKAQPPLDFGHRTA